MAASRRGSRRQTLTMSSALYQPSQEGYDQDRQGGGGKRMKKRGASEYITKEHGSYENRDAAEDPPKMSTAAQMARRKIATPKSRTGRSTTPTMPSNPFQSQPQPQPQQQSSGFQFGNTNQSFPPPNQSQSFQFSVPGAASSFTFGQSETQAEPVSNPFANMNGVNGGFGGHQVDNTDMQDEQAQPVQPAQSSSLFNFAASQPAPSTSTNGFSFGQSTTQQSNGGGFGGGLFGQQNTQTQNPGAGLFGQSSNTQQNGLSPSFGQSKPESTSSVFSQSTTTSAPVFAGFGNNTTSAPASTPTFSFGSTSVSPAPQSQSDESPAKTNNLFNFAKPQADSASADKKPSFTFGQPSTASSRSESPSASKPAFAGFGQPSDSQQSAPTSGSNLFSGFGAPSKPLESSAAQQSAGLFAPSTKPAERGTSAEASDSDQADEAPKNPFSSLFGSANAKSNTSSESAKPAKPLFQFGQSTSPVPATASSTQSASIFSKSTDPPPSTGSSAFDLSKSSTTNLSSSSTTTLFSPKPTTPASAMSDGLFNLNKPAMSSQETNSGDSSQAISNPAKPMFSFTPQKPAQAPAASTPNLFAFGSQTTGSPVAKNQTNSSNDDAPPPKKQLFQGSSTPDKMAQSALGPFTSSVPPVTYSTNNESSSMTAETSQQSTTRAVSTEGPPQIPRFLSGDKYKGYDESWRLKSLNRSFKNVITGLDPEKQDFMNIIQNYLDHREAIGEGLAGYQRKKSAGSKRKVADVDDLQDEDANNKRTKPATTIPAPPKTNLPSSSSVFSPAASKPDTGFTPAKTVADTQTSNMFKSMIPGASAPPAAPVFVPNKSTTPPSSPPKATAPQMPKFELPKFGGGANNFMSAFAKNSAANAKKFEQEAKEKRKAEEFDSDEDNEEEWDKKYEEEQRAKRAKIEAAAKNALAVPAFIPSASSSRSNSPFAWAQPIKSIETNGSKSPDPSQQGVGSSQLNAIEVESGADTSGQESGDSGDDEAEHLEEDEEQDDQEEEEEDEAEEIPDIPPEESLFSRISGKAPAPKTDPPIMQPAANNSFKPGLMFGNLGKSTPQQPTFSPITPGVIGAMPKGDFVPTTKFNFTAAPATSSGPIFGSSVLGSALKDGPIPGEGLFGSRPSTPSNADANKPFSGFSTSKQPADNTYKQGSPIKFGSSTSAPTVEVTAATPPGRETPKPFSNRFGQSTSNTTSTNGASLGFNFGTPSNGSQPAPGFLGAASHIGAASGLSSRATSPGMTSEAESVATDNTEDYSQEPQTSLISSNNGEENEDVLYEAKAKISRLYKDNEIPEKSKIEAGWNTMGIGIMRLLKDKASGKTRIVFRADPNANVILNTRLMAGGNYKTMAAGKQGAVTFPVATDAGIQMWMIRVKTVASAEEAAKAMEANKNN